VSATGAASQTQSGSACGQQKEHAERRRWHPTEPLPDMLVAQERQQKQRRADGSNGARAGGDVDVVVELSAAV
jgi:hypothetical protein